MIVFAQGGFLGQSGINVEHSLGGAWCSPLLPNTRDKLFVYSKKTKVFFSISRLIFIIIGLLTEENCILLLNNEQPF